MWDFDLVGIDFSYNSLPRDRCDRVLGRCPGLLRARFVPLSCLAKMNAHCGIALLLLMRHQTLWIGSESGPPGTGVGLIFVTQA